MKVALWRGHIPHNFSDALMYIPPMWAPCHCCPCRRKPRCGRGIGADTAHGKVNNSRIFPSKKGDWADVTNCKYQKHNSPKLKRSLIPSRSTQLQDHDYVLWCIAAHSKKPWFHCRGLKHVFFTYIFHGFPVVFLHQILFFPHCNGHFWRLLPLFRDEASLVRQAKGDSETASDPGSMGSIDEEKHVDLDRDSGRFADDWFGNG